MTDTEAQEISEDETGESADLAQHSSRLSTDRDDSPDTGPDEQPEDTDEDTDEDTGADQFPRPYVERLRARSAGYRTRATVAEARTGELEQALYAERVRALDLLADPADLPYDAEALEDPAALRAAVEDLVARKPHLRRRGVAGAETGAREQPDGSGSVSLLGLMRGNS